MSRAMTRLCSQSQTFCLLRRNGDGYIDREEFALIIRSTGEPITEDEIDELMKDGDKNADGMLDFDGMMRHDDDEHVVKMSLFKLFKGPV